MLVSRISQACLYESNKCPYSVVDRKLLSAWALPMVLVLWQGPRHINIPVSVVVVFLQFREVDAIL